MVLLDSFRRARFSPLGKRFNLALTERTIVSKLSAAGIGEPRRHLPRAHRIANRFSPGPRFFEAHERHGRSAARPVTFLAAALQNGDDVFIETGIRRLATGRRGYAKGENATAELEHRSDRKRL